MRTLSSSEILTLWERGVGLHPLDRALLALSVAGPSPTDCVADWPLGRRNRALLELHAACFSPQLEGWTSCPNCGEKVEFELDARQLAATAEDVPSQPAVSVGEQRFRLPTSRDLADVADVNDPNTAALQLLERCRLVGGETSSHTDEMTEELLEAIGESLASADPLAETRLALNCPSCQREWEDALDIGCFVWSEVEARARRLLWEVHSLASAYGWGESETLALGAARRAMYLEMVHA
jgi:hypothetical protein